MRNMLAFLAALVIALIGIGWYLDWFRFTVTPGSDGHRTVTIDVNTKKVSNDVKKGEELIEKERTAAPSNDSGALSIKGIAVDGKNIDVKTKNVEVTVP